MTSAKYQILPQTPWYQIIMVKIGDSAHSSSLTLSFFFLADREKNTEKGFLLNTSQESHLFYALNENTNLKRN